METDGRVKSRARLRTAKRAEPADEEGEWEGGGERMAERNTRAMKDIGLFLAAGTFRWSFSEEREVLVSSTGKRAISHLIASGRTI